MNDWVIYYSPKLEFGSQRKCQAFTAIGQVIGNKVYNYDMGDGFIAYRRDVQFWNCDEVPILPLIPHLKFIKNQSKWGYIFKFFSALEQQLENFNQSLRSIRDSNKLEDKLESEGWDIPDY